MTAIRAHIPDAELVQTEDIGRVFATAASLVLDLPVYDTQCGAKLFRASPDFRACLHEPFISRWIFDVELLARLRNLPGRTFRGAAGCVRELPLLVWRDVAGSRVTSGAFAKAALQLWAIHRRYQCRRLARARRGAPAAAERMAGAGVPTR